MYSNNKTALALVAAAFIAPISATAKQYVFQNMTGVSVDVYERAANGTETYRTTVDAGAVVPFEANAGDRFAFKTVKVHDSVDQIVIREDKPIYRLDMIRLAKDQLPASYTTPPNFDPSLHSYDIFYVDPFHIDNAKAKKGLVFERLDEKHRDYVVEDGNIIHKKGFTYSVDDTGWGSEDMEYFSSTAEFSQSFNASIKLSGGGGKGDAKAKGANGLGMDLGSGSERGNARAWTLSRQDVVKYRVGAVGDEPKLAEGFINAIRALPDANDPKAYRDFITTWGTHYPTEVTYGGFYMGVRSFTQAQAVDTSNFGIDISNEAAIDAKGVELGREVKAGYSEINTTSQLNKFSSHKYLYRGGEGGIEGWAVNDNAQPVEIRLKRLNTLLTSTRIPNSIVPASSLSKRAKNLEAAITAYVGTAKDANATTIKPRIYRLSWVDLAMLKYSDGGDGTPSIFGSINFITTPNLSTDQEPGRGLQPYLFNKTATSVWSRSDEAGSRVILEQGESYNSRYAGETDNKFIEFVVSPGKKGDYDAGSKCVTISVVLKDYDSWSANDTIGSKNKKVCLKDFNGKEFSFKVGDDPQARLTFKAEQVNETWERLFSSR